MIWFLLINLVVLIGLFCGIFKVWVKLLVVLVGIIVILGWCFKGVILLIILLIVLFLFVVIIKLKLVWVVLVVLFLVEFLVGVVWKVDVLYLNFLSILRIFVIFFFIIFWLEVGL